MSYIVHAAVRLHINYTKYEHDKWQKIKLEEGSTINVRLTSDRKYEIASDPISDKWDAINIGKRIYTSLLIQILRYGIYVDDPGCSTYANRFYDETLDGDRQEEMPECQLVWKKKCSGGGIGLDIYEADTLDEIDLRTNAIEVQFEQLSDSDILSKINLNQLFFDYTPITQECFATLFDADHVADLGLRMTLYCGILEKLVGEQEKASDVLAVIDELIKHVDESDLEKNKKDGLKNFLKSGKKESARGKIKKLCKQYAHVQYGEYKTTKIIEEAYSLRSFFPIQDLTMKSILL